MSCNNLSRQAVSTLDKIRKPDYIGSGLRSSLMPEAEFARSTTGTQKEDGITVN